jgi:hypothetical protein
MDGRGARYASAVMPHAPGVEPVRVVDPAGDVRQYIAAGNSHEGGQPFAGALDRVRVRRQRDRHVRDVGADFLGEGGNELGELWLLGGDGAEEARGRLRAGY